MRINEFTPDMSIFNSMDEKNSKESTLGSFADVLNSKLDEVNAAQVNSDKVTESFIKGEGPDVHEVMIASTEAQMSMELAVQLRNKFVEAYQELSRTQV